MVERIPLAGLSLGDIDEAPGCSPGGVAVLGQLTRERKASPQFEPIADPKVLSPRLAQQLREIEEVEPVKAPHGARTLRRRGRAGETMRASFYKLSCLAGVSKGMQPMSLGAWPLIRAVSRTVARSATTPPTALQSLIAVPMSLLARNVLADTTSGALKGSRSPRRALGGL
jgi:hypothetical protein